MKKLILAMSLAFPLSVSAAGIPTIDVAAIAQMIADGLEQATRFKQEMDAATGRFNEMRSQGEHYKDMVEGHYNFEDVLNDPLLNEFIALDDWKSIYDDVSELNDLRNEFNMFSNDPMVQRRYDNKLRQYNIQNKFYNSAVKRNKKMQVLLGQFSSATSPAAKEDIANSIRFEQTQIQNDNQMLSSLNSQMREQERLEAGAAARESTRLLLNEGIPRSQ